jgi:hypothetical protein
MCLVLLVIFASVLITGCDQLESSCQTSRALNYEGDVLSGQSDSLCKFSKVVWFVLNDSIQTGIDSTLKLTESIKIDTVFASDSAVVSIDTTTNIDSSYTAFDVFEPFDSTIMPLVLYVDGQLLDTIESAVPYFPGNCSSGLPKHLYITKELADDSEKTWTAVSLYENRVFSGTVQANPSEECVPVRVTSN